VEGQAEIPFAPNQHGYTKRFVRYVLDLAQHMTMSDVAQHLGISWNLVKAPLKEELARRYPRPALGALGHLATDEISIGHGHRYLTVVLDLETGAVVFVGNGKSAEALAPFWKRLRRSKAWIEGVAVDMSQAYINAVRTHLPEAILVFDHFHGVKLMNDKLPDLRRELQRTAKARKKEVLNPLAPAEEPREARSEAQRGRLSAQSPPAERRAGRRLLPEGGSESALEPSGQGVNWSVPGGLDRASPSHRTPSTPPDGRHAQPPPRGSARLSLRAHHHRTPGRHEQQDQDAVASGLRLPRSRVLPSPHRCSAPDPLGSSRMSTADGNR